jgi:hypothetical protein
VAVDVTVDEPIAGVIQPVKTSTTTVYLLVIDLHDHKKAVSKRRNRNPTHITKDELNSVITPTP